MCSTKNILDRTLAGRGKKIIRNACGMSSHESQHVGIFATSQKIARKLNCSNFRALRAFCFSSSCAQVHMNPSLRIAIAITLRCDYEHYEMYVNQALARPAQAYAT